MFYCGVLYINFNKKYFHYFGDERWTLVANLSNTALLIYTQGQTDLNGTFLNFECPTYNIEVVLLAVLCCIGITYIQRTI